MDDGEECGRWYMFDSTLDQPSAINCINGAVTKIHLGNNSLAGAIPAEIGLFSDSLGEQPPGRRDLVFLSLLN